MTREELHELLDIVMDAREKTKRDLEIQIDDDFTFIDWSNGFPQYIYDTNYPTFSDFTQAVKDYIKSFG